MGEQTWTPSEVTGAIDDQAPAGAVGSTLLPPEVAVALGLSERRVWVLAAAGELPVVKGTWPPRFRVADIADRARLRAARTEPEGRKAVDRADNDVATVARDINGRAYSQRDEMLTRVAAANLLGVSQATLRLLIASGAIVTVGTPPRLRRSAVDAFIARSRIQPGALSHMDPNAGRRAVDRDPPLTRSGRPDRRYGRR